MESLGAFEEPQPWTVRGQRGSRNASVRRHNLAAVLRSTLTRVTGLNRSTIGTVVATLEGAGLVSVADPVAEGSVGRPSPTIRPADAVHALSINPDIDAVRVALVGLGGRVLASDVQPLADIPTPADARAAAAALSRRVLARAPQGSRLVGAGVAVPGLVDFDSGTVVNAPHLGWRNAAIAEDWERVLGCPVLVGNDATVSLLAEVHFGAARGASDVLYLNGSASGIGGAALVGGRLMTGARGYGGEFGHMLIASGGALCDCGRRGCLETEVNVRRLEAAADRTLEVRRQAEVLADAISNLISAFNPELVVVGGFLADLNNARPQAIDDAVRAQAVAPLADGIAVVNAELAGDRLPLGGAELAFASVLDDPVPALP
jgi:predicted NBD/HSP70 family sugar kinase